MSRERQIHDGPVGDGTVLVVDSGHACLDDLVAEMIRQRIPVVRVEDSKLLPFFVLAGGVDAILLDVQSLGITELLALRKCRLHAPRTSVVAVSSDPTQADVKRALEGGATAFLPLPATAGRIREALRSGDTSARANP